MVLGFGNGKRNTSFCLNLILKEMRLAWRKLYGLRLIYFLNNLLIDKQTRLADHNTSKAGAGL
jgi:hypothetical protein